MKKVSGLKRERNGKSTWMSQLWQGLLQSWKRPEKPCPLNPNRRTKRFSQRGSLTWTATGWDRWDIGRKQFNGVPEANLELHEVQDQLPESPQDQADHLGAHGLSMSQHVSVSNAGRCCQVAIVNAIPISSVTSVLLHDLRTVPRGLKMSSHAPLRKHFKAAATNRMSRTLPQLDCEFRDWMYGYRIMGNAINWPCCRSGGFRCRIWCS